MTEPRKPTVTAVPPKPSLAARGFTLIELAIVMFILALLLGGMLLPLSAQQEVRARQETEKTLNDLREALIGFAVANKRLPRPATSATNGAENPASCANDAACSGFIPWATLGLPRTDGWGKLIRYSVTPAFANSDIALTSIPNRTVQTRDTAGTASYVAGSATCTTASACIPAVIFSHGKERWGTSDSGTALAAGPGSAVDEAANDAGPSNYFSRSPSANSGATGGEFDDLVTWLPTTVLINRLVSAGVL